MRENIRAPRTMRADTRPSAFDSLSAHVALINAKGVIITVNKAWRTYVNASGLQLPRFGVGQDYLKILEIFEGAHRARPESAAVVTAIDHALAGKQQEFEIDYPFHSPTRNLWFRIMVSPIGASELHGALVMHFDITARKTLEQGLRDQEVRHLLLLNSTTEGIFALEERGICTFSNLAAAQLLGYEEPRDMVGKSFHQLHHHSRPEGTPLLFSQSKINQGFEHGQASRANDEVFFRRDGTHFAVEYRSQPIRHESELVGTVVTFHDITRQQRLETLFLHTQKMETVGRLAGGIAHDFRNALAVIAGYSQLVEERMGSDENGRKYAHQIGVAAERAARFTRQLLGLNRKREPESVSLNLNTVITSMEEMLRRIIGENIALTAILDPKLRSVDADPGLMEQVLINLIVNARDAMPNGGELVIRTSNGDGSTQPSGLPFHAAGYLRLIVSDNGSGMDKATQGQIFEPFFTTKETGQGTGLGLSTVSKIAEDSNGGIRVQSVLGFGSTFTVFLPIVPSAPGPLSFSNVPERAIRGSETILVVEDEESFRTMISDALRSNGYTVLECQDGTNCIELAASYDKPIDLMLTDVMLPDVTGGRVAEVILNSRPSMEVLYMSGYTDEYITDLGILRPETTFLEKPFDLDLMLRAVRKALDGARANFPVAELPSSSPFPNP